MTARTLVVTPAARRDLRQIAEYLKQQAGARIALRWSEDVTRRVRQLRRQPLMGALDPDLAPPRRLVAGPYLVFYQYREADSVVVVARVLHGSRDLPTAFGSEAD